MGEEGFLRSNADRLAEALAGSRSVLATVDESERPRRADAIDHFAKYVELLRQTTAATLMRYSFKREFADVAFAISFFLPALRVYALLEIAIAIKQTNRNQRQIQVTGRLQMIARQNAQATRIQRQRAMDAELRTKISDRIDTVDRRTKGQSRRNASVHHIRIETLS